MNVELKPHAPACARNRDFILPVLNKYLSGCRNLLEIGSGTGQHAVYFAEALPHLIWQASDVIENLPGICMWLAGGRLSNTPPPVDFDVNGEWPRAKFDAVFSANTLHIMSWSEVERLFAGLPGIMTDDAWLIVYGPFNYQGGYTSDSNAKFDSWLKQRGAHMGIRDFDAVNALAQAVSLRLMEDRAMPANNRILVWRRSEARS